MDEPERFMLTHNLPRNMQEPDRMQMSELELWFEYVVSGVQDLDDPEEIDHRINNRAWFCGIEFEPSDFYTITDMFESHESSAGIAVLGREAEAYAETISDLERRGFEIVFHGHRHHKFENLSYEKAHDYLSVGLDAIEDATQIVPDGMFVPMSDASQGTVDALAELGFEWMVGRAAGAEVPDELTIVTPQSPYDDLLFEQGYPAKKVFEKYPADSRSTHTYIIHPPYQMHYDALNAFEDWIEEVQPVNVSKQLATGTGTSVILDCFSPFSIQ